MNDTLPIPPDEPGPTPEDVAAHLRATVGALVRATRVADELAPIPAAVLDLIDLRGPMTTAELAAERGVRPQTMTATVKELVDAGHLVAEPDPLDGRKKLLGLTPLGRGALEADRRQRVSVLAEAMRATMTGDERRVVVRALALIDRLAPAIAGAAPGAGLDRGPITGAW